MIRKAIIMGMPVVISIVDKSARGGDVEEVFDIFRKIDEKFSTYKEDSEITRINLGLLNIVNASDEVREIFSASEETEKETKGFFNIKRNEKIDPSGLVKGYAISKGAEMLRGKGYRNFYVEIAGDAEVEGLSEENRKWQIGIENPFNPHEIVKVLKVRDCGVATSGNYRNGKHIYIPESNTWADEIMSVTVVAKNAYDADRFATAAFAMGVKGIEFLELKDGLEGYMVQKDKKGRFTSGIAKYLID